MFDPRCPCTPDCADRPNCKGCVRGNEFRALKNKEAEDRYQKKAFERYEKEIGSQINAKKAKNSRKPMRLVTKGVR